MARDPVCGTEVDEDNPPATSQYQGNTYYFDSLECKRDFDKDPEKYVRGSGAQMGQQ